MTSNTEQNFTTLFVGGLSPNIGVDEIKTFFTKFGEIEDVHLIIDWVTGLSKCCAIVKCSDALTAKLILSGRKKSHLIAGQRVRIALADDAKKGTKIVSTKRLFLGNLPLTITKDDIKARFSEFGDILSLDLVDAKIERNASLNHAFLEFENINSARNVLDQRHNIILKNAKITVSPFREKDILKKSFKEKIEKERDEQKKPLNRSTKNQQKKKKVKEISVKQQKLTERNLTAIGGRAEKLEKRIKNENASKKPNLEKKKTQTQPISQGDRCVCLGSTIIQVSDCDMGELQKEDENLRFNLSKKAKRLPSPLTQVPQHLHQLVYKQTTLPFVLVPYSVVNAGEHPLLVRGPVAAVLGGEHVVLHF